MIAFLPCILYTFPNAWANTLQQPWLIMVITAALHSGKLKAIIVTDLSFETCILLPHLKWLPSPMLLRLLDFIKNSMWFFSVVVLKSLTKIRLQTSSYELFDARSRPVHAHWSPSTSESKLLESTHKTLLISLSFPMPRKSQLCLLTRKGASSEGTRWCLFHRYVAKESRAWPV